jgi:hypothetical protein
MGALRTFAIVGALASLTSCGPSGGGAVEPIDKKLVGRSPDAGARAGEIEQHIGPRLVGLSACAVDELGIEAGCPANDAWEEAWFTEVEDEGDRAAVAAVAARLGKQHLTHASAAVRIQSVSLLAESGEPAAGAAISAAIDDEEDEATRRAMVSEAASAVPLIPVEADTIGLGPMFIDLARDDDAEIRLLASGWLITPPFPVDGATDAVIEMMRNDPDVGVRGQVCQSAAGLGRDEVVAAMAAVTALPDRAPGEMYERCMSGLVEAWVTPWYPINEKAYRLTLDRLRATPRTDRTPPADALGFLLLLGTDHEQLDAWRAKATWFSAADLIEVLAAIAADTRAAVPARTTAIEVTRVLGAGRPRLEKLKKALGKKPDAEVAKAMDAALAAAPD